jgi:hypothetical protein
MMNRSVAVSLGLLVLAVLAGCGGGDPKPVQNILASYPELTSLVFENDYVRVVEFTLGPGDELPLHHGERRVVYSLSDYTLEWLEGEAEPITKEWTTGTVHFHDAVPHAARNAGSTEARYLVVSRKTVPLPIIEAYGAERDVAAADADHSKEIFENDQVRVIEVHIIPGEKQPAHHGLNRLIYALSDYTITYSSDRTGTEESIVEIGEAHWHGPDEHAVENTGETEAHYLIFAWKN